MTPYLAMFSARFRALLQYRAAALAGLCTQVFWGLIRMMVMTAFYENAVSTPPLSLTQVCSYIWLGQAFFALIPLRVDEDIAGMIRSGDVAYELLRPVDLFALWYSRAIANRIVPAMMRCVPILAIAALAGWLPWPGWPAALAGSACLLAAALLSAAIASLMTITVFWTLSGQGVSQLISMTAYLLSGMVIPLPLFPDWAQRGLAWLPFGGFCDLPYRVLVGHIPAAAAGLVICRQLAWLVLLLALGRWLVARAMRRVVLQGG
jgi:ABC-2 type transport system permease protein